VIRRPGFTLLEVLVGGAILATVGIAVLSALSQQAREVGETSDFTIALLLSEKVTEESMYGMDVDLHGDERLLELSGPPRSVQDDTHPYFGVIEDTAPPYGRLDPGVDLHIEKADEPLFRLYHDFELEMDVSPQPLAAVSESLIQVDSTFRCPAFGDRFREFAITTLLSRPVDAPRSRPAVAEDQTQLETQIITQLWPDRATPGATLSGVVASMGGDLAAVTDLGSIVTAAEFSMLAMDSLDDQVTAAQAAAAAAAPRSPDQITQLLWAAKLLELKAALAMKVLLWSKDPAQRLSTSLTANMVGGHATLVTTGVTDPMSAVVEFNSVFKVSVAAALDSYYKARQALPDQYPRAFRQFVLERKILELAELRTLQSGTPDVSFVQSWLDFLISYYKGRNRWAEAFAQRERQAITNASAISTLHPNVDKRVSDATAADGYLRALAARIATQ